jgi:DNA-binding transcriptional ArsR family regulator
MTMEELVFRAIAHPTRRRILHVLANSPLSVKELTGRFDVSQPAISQHLKELREAGLVASEREGLEQKYRLTPQPLRYVIQWSNQYRVLIDPAGHHWSFTASSVKPNKNSHRTGSKNGR